MKKLGFNPLTECPVYAAHVHRFGYIAEIELPSMYTALLIAVDASGISSEEIARVAESFVSKGLIWICAWGPDCERVHDIFDEVDGGDSADGNRLAKHAGAEVESMLMSTWHHDETLDDAAWFFLNVAFPGDWELRGTSYIAVTVGNPDWAATIESIVEDIPAFNARHLE